jgi:hypothetical protein
MESSNRHNAGRAIETHFALRLSTHIALRLSAIVMLLFSRLIPSHAHGFLRNPPARNVLANSDYCPHCLNAGSVESVSQKGTLSWPDGRHGICGDPFDGPRHHEEGGKFYMGGTPVVTYDKGSIAKFDIFLSTNHNGRFGFRICKIRKGPFDSEKEQLTEGCLNQHILKQADIPEAQIPGEEWYYTSPGDPTTTEYSMYYQLPENLTCDGVTATCVIQWYWQSANSCNPPGFLDQYKRPYGLADCLSEGAPYPEEFWNCATVAIVDEQLYTGEYKLTSFSQPPIVLYNSEKRPRFVDPLSNLELEVQNTTSAFENFRKIDKTMTDLAAANAFCKEKVSSFGAFVHPGSECQGYFLCNAVGSWYFECPLGSKFDSSKKACSYGDTVCVE